MYLDFDNGLAREHAAQIHAEVARNRLEARSAREARLAKASSLSEEARLAKARLVDETVLRIGLLNRSTSLIAALFSKG